MDSKRTHSSDLLHIPGREKTLAEIISKKSSTDENSNINKDSLPTLPPPNERKTFKIDSSDLLSRVQSFLPQLQNANRDLTALDPTQLDIENVSDDEQYIEMNLGLGVLEEKRGDSDEDDDDSDEIIISQNEEAEDTKKPKIEVLDPVSDTKKN